MVLQYPLSPLKQHHFFFRKSFPLLIFALVFVTVLGDWYRILHHSLNQTDTKLTKNVYNALTFPLSFPWAFSEFPLNMLC